MPPKRDIGWDFGSPIGDSNRSVKCNYCGKIITGGITRLKEHIAHIPGNVERCTKAPKEATAMLRKNIQDGKVVRATTKKRQQAIIDTIREETRKQGFVDIEDCYESEDEFNNQYLNQERFTQRDELKHMRNAMRESRRMANYEEDIRRRFPEGHSGAGASQSTSGVKRGTFRSSSVREGPNKSSGGLDSYMLPSKNKSIKHWFASAKIKDVGKAISKWFVFNAIPFNAADSEPYYQSMINAIAEAGPGIKGPSGYEIGGPYLDDEVSEIENYLSTLKSKWPEYGCTIMCDGWSTKNRHPIINFMIYCDRARIYHSSVDCTNKRKTTDFLLSLMNKVIDEVGEENVVHVVTDSEAANKAAGEKLMLERPHIFWSPCAAHCIDLMLEDIGKMTKVKKCIEKARKITSFIYNSDKLVNLMRSFTSNRELLRPGITRFATEFIAIESLIRHSMELKRMCTTTEWETFNNTSSKRRHDAENVTTIIMDARFWKRAREISLVMEPLVKVLKIVDQDKKPTLDVVYEAMDRAKLAIKKAVKDWPIYWDVIDQRWYKQLHQHLHAAAYFLNPYLQYSGTCVYTDEVRKGVKAVIKRLEPDVNAQAQAMNEVKLFVDKHGEFGSTLAIQAVKSTLPAEWWLNYGEDAPHLRKIAIKVLSQTCSSSGCERNWSTWSLIHTKIRNRLAVVKLHKLVFVHYNMRLRVRNLMYRREEDEYYSPIDLNDVFNDDDILDEWTRENDAPTLSHDDMQWLDEEIGGDEPEAEGSTQRRDGKGNMPQPSTKNKGKRVALLKDTEYSGDDSSDSDEDDGGGNDGDDGGQIRDDRSAQIGDAQHDSGMSWAQGKENYYATQDTDHGYRPGIEEQRGYLAGLQDFSSGTDHLYSGGTSRQYENVDHQLQSLGLGGYTFDHHPQQPSQGYEYSRYTGGRHNVSSFSTTDGYHGQNYGRHSVSSFPTSDEYHDQNYGSSDSTEYQRFGYYHHDQELPSQTSSTPYVDQDAYHGYPYEQSITHSTHYDYAQFSIPEREDNDDFEPPRHSTWY